jgi:hypothetical protein
VGRRTVAGDEGVAVVLVAEEVVDAFLFHQPGDEIEVGLAVLGAVLAHRILPGDAAQVEVRTAGVLEHLLQNILDRFVLENPDVGALSQRVQP